MLKNIFYNVIERPICWLLHKPTSRDYWNCQWHMAKAMLPYVKQYRKADRVGYTTVLYNDPEIQARAEAAGFKWDKNQHGYVVDPELIKAFPSETEQDSVGDFFTAEFNKILDEIIFSLEYVISENLKDCEEPNPDFDPKATEMFLEGTADERGYRSLVFNPAYGATRLNNTKVHEKEDRVQKGLQLLGKYWNCLWD